MLARYYWILFLSVLWLPGCLSTWSSKQADPYSKLENVVGQETDQSASLELPPLTENPYIDSAKIKQLVALPSIEAILNQEDPDRKRIHWLENGPEPSEKDFQYQVFMDDFLPEHRQPSLVLFATVQNPDLSPSKYQLFKLSAIAMLALEHDLAPKIRFFIFDPTQDSTIPVGCTQ